jgi:hypothetical protein
MGKQESTLELTVEGANLSGTASGNGETVPIYDGSVDGDSITWKTDITKPFALTVAFTGKVNADEMSGQAQAGMFPPSLFTGSRS